MNERFPSDRRIESAAVSTPRFVLEMLIDAEEESSPSAQSSAN